MHCHRRPNNSRCCRTSGVADDCHCKHTVSFVRNLRRRSLRGCVLLGSRSDQDGSAMAITTLSRSTICSWIRAGSFPRPVKLGPLNRRRSPVTTGPKNPGTSPRRSSSAWRDDYNHHRPHGALGHLTPSEYAERCQQPTSEVAPLQLSLVWGQRQSPAGL
jgi:hypothetical protein